MILNPNSILKQKLKEQLTDDEEIFISGECIPFTVALLKVFPHYEIAVLNNQYDLEDDELEEDDDGDPIYPEYDFDFVHSFCVDPKNSKIIIDVKGVRPISELYDDFYDINPTIDWDIRSAKQLIDEYSGKEFYSEESFEWSDHFYEEALKIIKNNLEKYAIKKKK